MTLHGFILAFQMQNQELAETQKFSRLAFWSIVRSGLWLVILILSPLIFAPYFTSVFEEFGIDLPTITEIAVSLGFRALRYNILYVVAATFMLSLWQLTLIMCHTKRNIAFPVYVDWFLIFAGFLFWLVAFSIPIFEIIKGLKS